MKLLQRTHPDLQLIVAANCGIAASIAQWCRLGRAVERSSGLADVEGMWRGCGGEEGHEGEVSSLEVKLLAARKARGPAHQLFKGCPHYYGPVQYKTYRRHRR